MRLDLYTPAGALPKAAPLKLAARRLTKLGFEVTVDESALSRFQRFAGDDDERVEAIARVAKRAPDIALATRGGYGLSRILDRIDWKRVAKSVEKGTQWVGQSDVTAFNLALLAHEGCATWAGPLACDDFGRETVDDVMQGCFLEAMHGELEAVGFKTDAGFDGLHVKGRLWGGNLCMVNALLGTRHWPGKRIKGGILFLEDVNEHPYRIERGLLQLHQAGVLDSQAAVVLGAFTDFRKVPFDRGFSLKTVVESVRRQTKTPILTGLPFGHVPTKVCLPVGEKVELMVDQRTSFIHWHRHRHRHQPHGH